MQDLHTMQQRIISLAFDVVSNILETGPVSRPLLTFDKDILKFHLFYGFCAFLGAKSMINDPYW